MLAEWRSVSMEYGEQSVVITMIVMWPELCADNWNTVSTQEDPEVSSAYLHVCGHVGGYTNN